MPNIKEKFFGNISIDEVGKAKSLFTDHDKYGKQLKIQATQWEDGGISITAYNKETKESFKIGNLRVSQFKDNNNSFSAPAANQPTENDLPF